jgi:hypothetical protein
LELPGLDCIFKPELALLSVICSRISFDNHDFAAFTQSLGQFIAGQLGSCTVIGTDECE